MKSKKAQFFIMSIVLLALAMFILMSYFLSIGESSAIMFEASSRNEFKNIQNAIKDDGNCDGNINLCDHFEQIYGGLFKLSCSTIGGTAPYNYTISIISKDLVFEGNLTYALDCPAAAVCGNNVVEGAEVCDYAGELCTGAPPVDVYRQDCVGDCGGGDPNARCKNDCTEFQIYVDGDCTP